MANITPGIIHYCGFSGDIPCGIEYTSDWDEDEDAEVITTNDVFKVTCEGCLKANLKTENHE